MKQRIEDMARLWSVIDSEAHYVRIGSHKDNGVLLLDGLGGFLSEAERYLDGELAALNKQGYTGDLSEVVLD
jgi:hypothetical protein